jgi:hypothetical protein
MASGDTLVVFRPLDNQPPATGYATFDTRNSIPVLDFDAASDEDAVFGAVLPRFYGGGGITATLYWLASSAVAGDVIWNAAFERNHANGDDLDADSFATAQAAAATTANGTSGKVITSTITFTDGAQIDSLAAGEAFRLKVTRDANAGGDTMAGDAELLMVELKET